MLTSYEWEGNRSTKILGHDARFVPDRHQTFQRKSRDETRTKESQGNKDRHITRQNQKQTVQPSKEIYKPTRTGR